ncbi:MAG TPA: carboxypeptidase-like regulatory domain-containing protein [Planctomycetota bacterium]|nr:carboxypeptidase-like regulatory domain-containing protein [Planctomycetota bacterium]
MIALLFATCLTAQQARLEGCVVDARSQAVPNATITIVRDGAVIAHTQGDGEGHFVVGRLPQAVLTVRATSQGPCVGAASVDLELRPRAFASVRLMPARRLSGRVLDAEGAAVAGAFVATTPVGAPEFGVLGTACRSDAEGRFVFGTIPFGRNAVRAWRKGAFGIAAEVDGTADVELECRFDDDEPQQRNFELQDATAAQRSAAVLVIGAFAEGSHMPLPPELQRPAPDDTACWRVHGWPWDDEMRARLLLPGGCSDPDEIRVPGDTPDRTKVFHVEPAEVAMVRGVLVGGQCELPGGLPLAIRSALDPDAPWTLGHADRDGSFVLPSPVGRDRVFCLRCLDKHFACAIDASDWSPSEGYRARHRVGFEHHLVLAPAHTVRCTVRQADGAPLQDATIALLSPDLRFMRNRGGRGAPGAARYAEGNGTRDGTCELGGLGLPEGMEFVCRISGPGGFLEQRFVVSGEAVQDLGVLTAGPAATLRGRAVSAAGRPLPGARVRVVDWGSSEHTHVLAADRDGSFVVTGLMPGPCDVQIAGIPGTRQSLTLEAGSQVDVTLK